MAVAQHDVARLKIPIEKVIEVRAQQKLRQAAEIVFQRLLVEGNAGEPEKIIFEIIQIPGDGLAIEAARADSKLCNSNRGRLRSESAATRPQLCDMPRPPAGAMFFAGAIFREKLKKRRVSEILFEISALAQILRINFRHRQSVRRKCLENSRNATFSSRTSYRMPIALNLPLGQPDDACAPNRRAGPGAAARARPASENAAQKVF